MPEHETNSIGDAQILAWNAENLLAEVVGYETHEVARTAHGSDLTTFSGRSFIDLTGGVAVHAAGHGHPGVVEAIRRQAELFVHTSDIVRHAPQLELAAFLRDRFQEAVSGAPWSLLFKNSGSESIDAAAKLALKATGRTHFVAFEGAFHGRTLFATALSCSKTIHRQAYEAFLEPLSARIHHAPAPRGLGDGGLLCADGLEELLDTIGSDVAGVFFEPIQGEGGYWPMTPEAAQKIRALTRARGILLIADEIQSGCGRTGRWFGFERLGIAPDIVVFGKAVGGGLPLAGMAAPAELMEQWTPGEHGTTFGGNPIACAAGLAALKVVRDEGLLARASTVGEAIQARLRPLVGQHGVADVRGHGLMIGVELRDFDGRPDYARCERVKMAARERGLLILTCGSKIGNEWADNSTLRLIPALNIEEDVLEEALGILEEALGGAG